ncbi:MAG: NAD(+) synthase [Clostridiales bacterium]|nr:NAD(+) synthase [Clostridiales bacterium]MDD6873429.1 NAD(+) synthase [Clostridiales bacterium]MDD7366679.1 NAD(+) synthase [Clostridiales bacterium]MDY2873212.1 NAD(+) synthase [Eubacteriales bacterium]
MKDGFISVAVGTPQIHVADCDYNAQSIIALMREAAEKGVKLLALPELCVTGYTCADLFLQNTLIDAAAASLEKIIAESAAMDMLIMVGLPVSDHGRLYNCVAAVKSGALLALIPKRFIPNYSVYYEARHFTAGPAEARTMRFLGRDVPFGANILLECNQLPAFRVAAEVCEDLWVPASPSIAHAMAGATVVCNASASDDTVGKADYRRQLVSSQSAKLICGYLYADAGMGESSQDMVYSGQNMICENGVLLAESARFSTGLTVSEIDVGLIESERRRMNSFVSGEIEKHTEVCFDMVLTGTALTRFIDPMPFVPSDRAQRDRRCEEILAIQAQGLMQRLRHVHAKTAVIGVSGGLDSTLALLVTARAFRALDLDPQGIYAITMPCYGTTRRTRSNAETLSERLGLRFMEIPIGKAVEQHFKDIGQDMNTHDVTYENGQARERTQVLMDMANKNGGLVIGTGDLSELALGWATYNGDHMSMYGVNVSVPKTLVRYLVDYEAETTPDPELRAVLKDILDTPVSPELLPPVDGDIAQKTEDLVGPYELHDFFLYNLLRRAYPPEKVLRLALIAFDGRYDEAVIRSWLKVFCRRFFNQQFKRSCLPDGPKVGSVTLSPRGDLRMPSDASSALWLKMFS